MFKGEQTAQDRLTSFSTVHAQRLSQKAGVGLFSLIRWAHLARSVYEGLIENSCLF